MTPEQLADDLEGLHSRTLTAQSAAAELRRLAAENDALRKDAERYRWLRDAPIGDDDQEWISVALFDIGGVSGIDGKELDTAIDAAMKETP